ncbi:DUF1292 domain-containing protein [Paenibacillus sp. GCM10027626]|uniref:DUF1292 domain-containing protein n=1 Tax=Paenibacillus sp. GCM10027626 TaxID=3273411 RepID=UPI00363383AC
MSTVEKINLLQQTYGDEIELTDDAGTAELYRIAAEFRLGEQAYVGLQTAAMRKEDEVAFFRVILTEGDGEPQLESIDDDEEWEAAAEAYDDLLFIGDDQP